MQEVIVIGFALNLDSSPQTASFYRNGSAIATNVNIDGLANQTLFPMTSHYKSNITGKLWWVYKYESMLKCRIQMKMDTEHLNTHHQAGTTHYVQRI